VAARACRVTSSHGLTIVSILDRTELEKSPLADLHAVASELGIEGYRRLGKTDLIGEILAGPSGDEAGAGKDGRTRGENDESADRDKNGKSDTSDTSDESDKTGETGARRRPARRGRRPARAGSGAGKDDAPEAQADDADRRPRRSRRAAASVPHGDDSAEQADGGAQPEDDAGDDETRAGLLDIVANNSGFMRVEGFAHSHDDAYVAPAQIRRCELRAGDELLGRVRSARRSERFPSLVHIETVNGGDPEAPVERPRFEELTPGFATERLAAPDGLDGVPFGKGSRVAIAGLPGAGATTLLRRIVVTLLERHEQIGVVVVLAGVRPEEVPEWRRLGTVPVAGGGFDRSIDEQGEIAGLVTERAKREVERGRDFVIAVDSLDALSQANARRVFAAARNTEEQGSLTVIATTGLAGEAQRQATTRIVLDASAPGAKRPAVAAIASGTARSGLLA